MATTGATYVAILDRAGDAALRETKARALPLAPAVTTRPARGDRVAFLSVHGPLFVSDAAFVATADVLADTGAALELRHRVLAPSPHAVALRTLPSLRVAAGWTHGALGGLRGSVVRCTARDFERVEAALLALARAHGPRPDRPLHRRPRTPGRRALLAGRAAAGRRP